MRPITRYDAGYSTDSPPRFPGVRVALYSHDTMGLGHLRRNLLIADALASSVHRSTNLIITGAHEANFFRLPERTDCLTLPRWSKSLQGSYSSARLQLAEPELIRLRAHSVCSALEVFAPDLFIVDKVPAGVFGELLPALRSLTQRRRTRIVLGLRDVLDEPANVAAEWLCQETVETIDQYYDAVWIYGDRRDYDAVAHYQLPEAVSRKTAFTGFIDQSRRLEDSASGTRQLIDSIAPGRPLVACALGGGQDGASLAELFIDAMPDNGSVGVVVAGPFMPPADLQKLHRRARGKSCIRVIDFLPEADLLLQRAERVVSMAGYNTVCSILSFQKHALLVPRIHPRREQWVRATGIANLGLADTISPDELTADALRRWISQEPPHRLATRSAVDLDGLARIDQLTGQLLGRRRQRCGHPVASEDALEGSR